DDYNIPEAMSDILPFIEDASNWYVRRSRRRFWKSDDDGDKAEAYRTLHYVLLKLSMILAPFTPFLAEELYQNLGGTESVHLLDWPTNYAVDQQVLDEMEQVRTYVNEGLSLRARAGLKVRQPLASVTVPTFGECIDTPGILLEELNVKEVQLGDDVAIDELLTPELKREGLMREVIRHVQAVRKNAGLNVDDRINLQFTTESEDLEQAIAEHGETIKAETLTESIGEVVDGFVAEVTIESKALQVSLKKV
ncbi:MAG: class I tRNA ligase family protein, partial [Candidatus Saccharimonas sp.]